jgi:hypothetical protein
LLHFLIAEHPHLSALHFREHQLSEKLIFAHRVAMLLEPWVLGDEPIQLGFEFLIGTTSGVRAVLRLSLGDFISERHGALRVETNDG